MKYDDIKIIDYYINISEQYNLSVRQLRERIKSNEYERLPEATKNKITNQTKTNTRRYKLINKVVPFFE